MKFIHGDTLSTLKTLPSDHYHAALSDPPYGISFLGKHWDYDIPAVEVWQELHRTLKPGAYALIACGTRTQHRMAVNLEDAGFEIKDIITWLYGSGFPKNQNLSRAIDDHLKQTREITRPGNRKPTEYNGKFDQQDSRERERRDKPASPQAEQWQGYGNTLKPAVELFTLIRKPPQGNNAQNALTHHAGSLNIDGTRIPIRNTDKLSYSDSQATGATAFNTGTTEEHPLGRYPTNLILDENADQLLPETARYFYSAKVSPEERQAGLKHTKNNHPTLKPIALTRYLATLLLPPAGPERRILIPYSGTGSEAIGAHQAGWESITGIEREHEYITIAEQRARYHQQQTPLPLL